MILHATPYIWSLEYCERGPLLKKVGTRPTNRYRSRIIDEDKGRHED